MAAFSLNFARRRMRNLGVAVAAVVAVVAVVMGALFYRLSSGPNRARFRDRLARGGDQGNLGDRYSVEVGGTVLERDENGRTGLRIRDIMVRDGDGSWSRARRAPRSDSPLQPADRHPRAESLNLVGARALGAGRAEWRRHDFCGGDKRPLARARCWRPPRRSRSGISRPPGCRVVAASPRGGLDNSPPSDLARQRERARSRRRDLSEVGLKERKPRGRGPAQRAAVQIREII